MTSTDPTPVGVTFITGDTGQTPLTGAQIAALDRLAGEERHKLRKWKRRARVAQVRVARLDRFIEKLRARIRVLEASVPSTDAAAVAESNRQRMLRAEGTLTEVGAILTRISDDIAHMDPRATHGYAVAGISTPTLVMLASSCMETLQANEAEPLRQAQQFGLIGAENTEA